MFAKLESIEKKYEDLEKELASPDVFNDQDHYRKLTKAHADLGEVVKVFREYRSLEGDLRDNEEMLHDDDADIREMAKAEIDEIKPRLPELEEQLKLLLLPKDPLDEKNIILEIRAGTGGEEAALFAADLFRMYSRYAETKGWKMEIMSASETGTGGYKEVIASIAGDRVYSHLKYESGIHRVQRVPATESQGAHPHQRRDRGHPARGRRGRGAAGRRGPAHRRVPFVGPRRAERQHHGLGHPRHPPAHRAGGHLPGREVAAQEQGQGPQGPQGASVPA